MMNEENYILIRNAFNDCYNIFYSKWAKKALLHPLSDEDWINILNEAKGLEKKYINTICHSLTTKLLIELMGLLENV